MKTPPPENKYWNSRFLDPAAMESDQAFEDYIAKLRAVVKNDRTPIYVQSFEALIKESEIPVTCVCNSCSQWCKIQ